MVVYTADYTPIEDILKKLKKTDKVRFESVIKKISQILEKPHIYKPLKNVLKGMFRAHVGHFVLIFIIHEEHATVEFVEYGHHDNIYK